MKDTAPKMDSDLMGEQMGDAVNRLLSPSAIAEDMIRDFKSSLVAKIVRPAVGVALALGWEPASMRTIEHHDRMLEALTKMYLDKFGGDSGLNSMTVNSMGKDYIVRSSSFKEGDQEKMGDWAKQVEYAKRFLKERTGEEKLRFGLEEAVNIVQIEKVLQQNRDRLNKK